MNCRALEFRGPLTDGSVERAFAESVKALLRFDGACTPRNAAMDRRCRSSRNCHRLLPALGYVPAISSDPLANTPGEHHMPRLVDRDIEGLRELALRMGTLAEAILAKSLRAVTERDIRLANEVQSDDLEIDRLDLAIDEVVLSILATKAPVAADLRFVMGTKTMATDIERVGDLARNIGKAAIRLAQSPIELPPKLAELATQSARLFRKALDSYANTDAALAREVLAQDDIIDEGESRVIRDAIAEIAAHPEISSQEVDLILIAKNLERVGDHATNIAEDVILMAEALNLKHADKLAASTARQS